MESVHITAEFDCRLWEGVLDTTFCDEVCHVDENSVYSGVH